MSEMTGTTAPEQSKTDRKLEALVRVLRKGQRDRFTSLLSTLPLEKPRVMRVAAHHLQLLAEANDGCLVELASALCKRVHNTPAASYLVKTINQAAKPLFENRHWRESADLLKLALELEPGQHQVQRQLARALAMLGERSQAVAILLPLLVSNPAMVPAATILARYADPKQMAEIAKKVAPLTMALANDNPAMIPNCVRVLIRLMCFDDAAALLPRLGKLEDPVIAKAAFEVGMNTNNASVVSRAIQDRRWLPNEKLERDVWLSQLALLKADRDALSESFNRLSVAGELDLLGGWRRHAGHALGRYAEAFSANWNWSQRAQTAKLLPNLFQPNESLESLAGARVLIIAYAELGDEIYPLELVDRIRRTFGSCTIVVDRRIAGLVARSRPDLVVFGAEKLVPAPSDNPVPDILRRHLCPEVWSEIDRFDKVLLIQDLQALLIRTEDDLPRQPKTLDADPGLRAKWREHLDAADGRPRVGLFWRSGLINYRRTAKLTELKDWAPVLEACQAPVVSLQYGPGISDEIESIGKDGQVIEMAGLDTRDDLESVSALMCELDLIVTIPGTTMHLAGGLGLRTLAVSHPAELLRRARLDGRTGTWSPNVEMVSGPSDLGFEGAIRVASQRVKSLLNRN